MEPNEIARLVLKEFSGCKYVYSSTITDAICTVISKYKLTVSDDERMHVRGIVVDAIRELIV